MLKYVKKFNNFTKWYLYIAEVLRYNKKWINSCFYSLSEDLFF